MDNFFLQKQLHLTACQERDITLQSSLAQASRDGHEGVEICAAHLLGCQLHHGLGSQQGLAPEPVEGVGGDPGVVDVIDIKRSKLVSSVSIGKQAGGIAFWKITE